MHYCSVSIIVLEYFSSACMLSLTSSSFVLSPPSHTGEVLSVRFVYSQEKSPKNATIFFWQANEEECSQLVPQLPSTLASELEHPRGLYIRGQPKCFPDDVAKAYAAHFHFVLYVPYFVYSPLGAAATHIRRSNAVTPIPIFQSDFIIANSSDADAIRIDISATPNPYTTAKVLVPYYLLSAAIFAFNAFKLYKCYERFLPKLREKKFELTSSAQLLLIEALASVLSCVALCDFWGLAGVLPVAVAYPMLLLVAVLGNLSSLILIDVFRSALHEIDEIQGSYTARRIFTYAMWVLSLIPSGYEAYMIITLRATSSPAVTGFNVLFTMSFAAYFSVTFFGAKKKVLLILGSPKGMATEEQKKIRHLSHFMHYSALAMILYVIALLVLGAVLSSTGNAIKAVFPNLIACFALTMTGFTQVLALPAPEDTEDVKQ